MKKVLMLVMLVSMGLIGSSLAGEMVQTEWWTPEGTPAYTAIPADFTAVEDWLATQTPVPGWPLMVSLYQFPDDATDYWCGQNIGWITAPASGKYTFWINGDDSQRLWLSSNSVPLDCKGVGIQIAGYDGWTGWDNWDWYTGQKSAPIDLVAGRSYWTRSFYQDGNGGGTSRVAWQTPGMKQGYLANGGATPVDLPTETLSATAPTQWSQTVGDVTVNPSPANDATGVTYPAATLTWEKAADVTPPSAISKYKLYFGKSVAVGNPADPNGETLYFKKEVAAAGPLTYDATGLTNTTTYYWRVDTLLTDGNVAYGRLWSFQTIVAVPVIKTQPATKAVPTGCTGSFTVEALSGELDDGGPLTFTWKKQDGTVVKTETKSEAGIKSSSYETGLFGIYYVDVSNANGTVKSNEFSLTKVAHSVADLSFTAVGDGNSAGVGVSTSGETITIIGSGSDIWNAADGFEYAYMPVDGDFDVTCRVASFSSTNSDGWSKSGIMIRKDLTAGSPHVIIGCSQSNGLTMQGRQDADTTNNGNHSGLIGGGAYPYGFANIWLRMTRAGDVITCYVSTDGTATAPGAWQLYPATATENTVTISNPWTRPNLAGPVYVGLAVGAHTVGLLNTTSFDHVKGIFPSWSPTNPTYSYKTPEGWIDPTQDLTVGWTKAAQGPCGPTYTIYGGESAGSMIQLGTSTTESFTIPASMGLLQFNKTYFWRVDVSVGSETEQGTVWTFDTVKQYPTIMTQPAQLTVVNSGATANLNLTVKTATVPAVIPMVKYEWFKVGNSTPLISTMPIGPDGDGNYTCPLAIPNTQLAQEGYYYCVITNTVGDTTSAQGLVLTHRLMLHYTFESVTGNVIADQSSSGFNATLIPAGGGTGAVYGGLIDGGIGLGKAIKLIGTNDPNSAYIDTGKKPMELGVSGNFPKSVSVWAKALAFTESGLYDMGAYADNQDFSLRTMPSTNNTWRVQYWGGGDRDAVVNPSFNAWVHFVHVFDGAKSQLYVNGKQVLNWATALDTNNGANLVLGRWNNNAQIFNGLMDDFRLYNYALTPAEAAQLYLAVKGGGPICAVPLLYDLDGNCKVDLNDFALFSTQWLMDTLLKP